VERANVLPEQFSQLARFVPQWALENERARFMKLHSSQLEVLREFYDAMLPRLEEILEFLKSQPLEGMPSDVRNLFYLAMTFAETAHPIDLNWKAVDFPSAYPWERFEFRTVSIER